MSDDNEWMDIVDESDHVIGRGTRSQIHANHDIHRGVHVFVVNDAGELLLQKRSLSCSNYPGYWDASVGGQVLSGESYEAAASRELAEELGCSGTLRLIGQYNSFSERQREKRRLFECRHEGPFEIDAREIEAVEFHPVDELGKFMRDAPFTKGFKLSFDLWLQHRFN